MPKYDDVYTIEINGPKGWEIVWEESAAEAAKGNDERFENAIAEWRSFNGREADAQFRLTTPQYDT